MVVVAKHFCNGFDGIVGGDEGELCLVDLALGDVGIWSVAGFALENSNKMVFRHTGFPGKSFEVDTAVEMSADIVDSLIDTAVGNVLFRYCEFEKPRHQNIQNSS